MERSLPWIIVCKGGLWVYMPSPASAGKVQSRSHTSSLRGKNRNSEGAVVQSKLECWPLSASVPIYLKYSLELNSEARPRRHMRAISSSSSVEKAHILVVCHHLQADQLNCSITMRSFLFFIVWRCPYSRGFAPLTEGCATQYPVKTL